jgi:hypothetical protein
MKAKAITLFFILCVIALFGCKPKEEQNAVVAGQIFIVTKERVNIVLGDEKVALVGLHETRNYLNSEFIQKSNELVRAREAVDQAMSLKNTGEGNARLDAALIKQVELWNEFNWPPPSVFEPKIDFTTTDGEGRFKFIVPHSKLDLDMVICAKTERTVGDKVERYWWMEVVELKGRKKADYVLSNDNNDRIGARGWFDDGSNWKWLNSYEAQMDLNITQNDYNNWLKKLK